MNNPITLQTIITVVGFLITILTFRNNQRTYTLNSQKMFDEEVKDRQKRIEEEVRERTKMYTKIDGTCNQIGEILRAVDKMTDRVDAMAKKQVAHDEQIHTIYKELARQDDKLEDHSKRLRELEKTEVK